MRLVQREVITTGEVPAKRREELLLPLLAQAEMLFEGDPIQIRVAVQSVVFLIVRYSMSTHSDLKTITASDEPVQATEDQLVRLAKAMLETK